MALYNVYRGIYKSKVFPFTLKECPDLIEKYTLKNVQFFDAEITLLDKFSIFKENTSRLKIFIKIAYFCVINRRFRERFFVFKKSYKAIEKNLHVGFKLLVFRKPLVQSS